MANQPINIQANTLFTHNPADGMYTSNPALSEPYIKYYTSIMEEYRAIEDNTKTEIIDNNTKQAFVYSKYINQKPYNSMNPFPVMQYYRGSKSKTAMVNSYESFKTLLQSHENNKGNKITKEVLNDHKFEESGSDIILTYKSSRSSYSVNNTQRNKDNSRVQPNSPTESNYEILSRITTQLSMGIITKSLRDTEIGNDSSMQSYAKQIIHAYAYWYLQQNPAALPTKRDKSSLSTYRKEFIIASARYILEEIQESIVGNDKNKNFIDHIKDKIKATDDILYHLSAEIDSHKSYIITTANVIVIIMALLRNLYSKYIDDANTNKTIISPSLKATTKALEYCVKCAWGILKLLDSKSTELDVIAIKNIPNNISDFNDKLRDHIGKELAGTSQHSILPEKAKEIYATRYRTLFGTSVDNFYSTFITLKDFQNSKIDRDEEIIGELLSLTDFKKIIYNEKPLLNNYRKNDESKDKRGYYDAKVKSPSYKFHPSFWQDNILESAIDKIKDISRIEFIISGSNLPISNKQPVDNYSEFFIDKISGLLSLPSILSPSTSSNIMRSKNLEIRNKYDNKTRIGTTITKFQVSIASKNKTIFMEGHDGPIVQNFGGPGMGLSMSILTNDIFLLDNITTASQELEVTNKTRSQLDNVSPLSPLISVLRAGTKINSLAYNKASKNLASNLKKWKDPNQSIPNNIDAPILITNNIANMAGIYGVVINEIQVNSVPEFPNTYQVDVNMIAVDINQQYRETPRKVKSAIDPMICMLNACRFTNGSQAFIYQSEVGLNRAIDMGLLFQNNNIKYFINKIIAQLCIINFISKYVEGKDDINDLITELSTLDKGDKTTKHWKKTMLLCNAMFKYFIQDIMGKTLQEYYDICNNTEPKDEEATKAVIASFKNMSDKFKRIIHYKPNDKTNSSIDFRFKTMQMKAVLIDPTKRNSPSLLPKNPLTAIKNPIQTVKKAIKTLESGERKNPYEIKDISIHSSLNHQFKGIAIAGIGPTLSPKFDFLFNDNTFETQYLDNIYQALFKYLKVSKKDIDDTNKECGIDFTDEYRASSHHDIIFVILQELKELVENPYSKHDDYLYLTSKERTMLEIYNELFPSMVVQCFVESSKIAPFDNFTISINEFRDTIENSELLFDKFEPNWLSRYAEYAFTVMLNSKIVLQIGKTATPETNIIGISKIAEGFISKVDIKLLTPSSNTESKINGQSYKNVLSYDTGQYQATRVGQVKITELYKYAFTEDIFGTTTTGTKKTFNPRAKELISYQKEILKIVLLLTGTAILTGIGIATGGIGMLGLLLYATPPWLPHSERAFDDTIHNYLMMISTEPEKLRMKITLASLYRFIDQQNMSVILPAVSTFNYDTQNINNIFSYNQNTNITVIP